MEKMPVIFIGHGSPMNAIEENDFTRKWAEVAEGIPKPKAILSISAHWFTEGSRLIDENDPKMIYDMYGFPSELYELEYPAKGAKEFAKHTKELITSQVIIDNTWGLDHGTWSVLNVMFPKADIPVYQLSIDKNATPQEHFQIGKQLKLLREEGGLILGSGNVVHNLSKINFDSESGYPWAKEFDKYIKNKIVKGNYKEVVDYKSAGKSMELSVPTPDHFYPLLYILGASDKEDKVTVFNEACIMGSLSMTSYIFE